MNTKTYVWLLALIGIPTMMGAMQESDRPSCTDKAQTKLVYLIVNPRAGLVEFLRMIGERGDFKVMHIPANWAYCHAHNYTHLTQGWYREDAPATYEEANDLILEEAQGNNIFVGENTHAAKDFLDVNADFLKDPRVQLVFLIRNPHNSIISYYEKKKSYFDELPPEQLSESMGFEFLYTLCKKIEARGGTMPLIIKSEDMYSDTEKSVRSLCAYLEVPYSEESLHWDDTSKDFSTFADYGWYSIELSDCSRHWHMAAIKSTEFSKPQSFSTDEHGVPTFEEIANPKHRKMCVDAYTKNLGFYTDLLKMCEIS